MSNLHNVAVWIQPGSYQCLDQVPSWGDTTECLSEMLTYVQVSNKLFYEAMPHYDHYVTDIEISELRVKPVTWLMLYQLNKGLIKAYKHL